MTSSAYLLIYLAFLEYVFADLIPVSSMIMHLSITEEVCVHACMSTHIMMHVSPGFEQDACTNTSLRFVRAISLWRVNCG